MKYATSKSKSARAIAQKQQAENAARYVAKMNEERSRPYVVRFMERAARVIKELEHLVQLGEEARAGVTEKMHRGAGEFAYQVSWGYGISEDLMAKEAAHILSVIRNEEEQHDLVSVLRWARDEKVRNLTNNRYIEHSTSKLSNAVKEVEGEVAKSLVEKLNWWIEEFTEIRADAELL